MIPLILRIITSFGIAFSAAKVVTRFELLDFAYAPLLTALVLFTSLWLLSKKYELPLHVLTASVALLLVWKSFFLSPSQNHSIASPEVPLFTTAFLLEWEHITNHRAYPDANQFKNWIQNKTNLSDKINYCALPCSILPKKIAADNTLQKFCLWTEFFSESSRDNKKIVWYVDASLKLRSYE